MKGSQNWLVLGTVQIGLPYGRRAGLTPMSETAAFAILDTAWSLGVRCFDVAEAYGVAIERLAAWLTTRRRLTEAQVVSKVRMDDLTLLPARLEAALLPLQGVEDLTLLTHGVADGEMWATIRTSGRRAGVQVGQSVYTPDEVTVAASAPGIARIQAPGNLFDRRALQARGDRVVPLDIRSAFLQGVLLETPASAEARAPGAGVLADAVQLAARDAGVPANCLLLAVMLRRLRAGDRLVVGVDTPDELASTLEAAELPASMVVAFEEQVAAAVAHPSDPRTLDPRQWPTGLPPGSARS